MADGRPGIIFSLATIICLFGNIHSGNSAYLGKFLGKLSELHHGVTGEVYAVDARTLHIKDFTYDGEGPAAYFYVGSSRTPSNQNAFRVRDEAGNPGVLKRYRRKSITLTLPDGKNLNNINWFSIWCDEFAVNFGDVKIPRNFEYPKPQKVEALRGVHGVASDPIVIVDAQTILIPHLSYDGEAPDAKFWVGQGAKPSPQGIKVPDENGKIVPLRRYERKTVVLTLPGELTVFDIGHFGIWCEAFTVDFGHIRVPSVLNVPPSLKMLGVSPQSKLNCEVLFDEQAFEVRWAVAGDSIVLQLVAKLDNNEYMSFGLSGHDSRNQMIGGDVVVAWVDRESMKGYAVDYFLHAKSQCSGPTGSCPDDKLADNTDNIRLLNAAMVNGYSIVTYQRPLKASDEFDRQIYTNKSQAIIWATGPLNQRGEVSFHTNFLKKNHLIEFGRSPKWNCPLPDTQEAPPTTDVPLITELPEVIIPAVETTTRIRTNERRRGGNQEENEKRRGTNQRRRGPSQQQASETIEEAVEERPSRRRGSTTTTERPRAVPTPKAVSKRNAWSIPPIQCFEPDDGVFYAQMGPTGGKRGYPAITGHVGWGISWYINGLLIPEINVVRGKQYTFVVEGGLDPEIPAKYHPFYITDDPIGGYGYKTPEERQNIHIYAGARQSRDGNVVPTGLGRLCHWTHTGDKEADDFPSFGAFQRTLELRCDVGEPGVISWTPDANTPDTVYYQCFSHRYLGWKINVLDACDEQPEGSAPEPSLALPDDKNTNGDLKSSSSILIETRVKPNDLFQTTRTKPSSKLPEDRQPTDNHDTTSSIPVDQQIITEKPTDISYIFVENNKDPSASETLNFGETYPENLTSTTQNQDAGDIITTQTRDKLLESPNNQDPLELMSMMFPAGRLPLEPQFGNIPRRPSYQNRPNHMNKPIYVPIHRPHSPNFKKHFYRTPIRRGPIIRPIAPIPHVHPTNTLQNSFTLTQEPILMMPPPIVYLNASSTTPLTGTEPTTTDMPKMRPAINTGFHPESVVIESGFRPIINKEFEKRISEDIEEPSEEIGVIRVAPENTENSQKLTETFEPIFIPSPLDSHAAFNKKQNQSSKYFKRRFSNLKKNAQNRVVIIKGGRSTQDDVKSDDGDEMVMAAERIESYYLPPDDKNIKLIAKARKPSNIDIPPGQVVTYDGKTVSGVSLTAPVSSASSFESRSSKTDLLRKSPQFGPFRGEKPPLNPQNVNIASIPQLSNHATINRGLNAPEPTGTHTTKLSPVRFRRSVSLDTQNTQEKFKHYELPLSQVQDFEDVRGARIERHAHHTPEHTEEQKINLAKLAANKKVIQTQEESTKRTKRNPHHTPEHTAEQKRDAAKIALGKKVVQPQEENNKKTKRFAHHTPEHTAEQKRDATKLAPGKKVVPKQEENIKRTKRNPHHTPEHTAEQKRDAAKLAPGKKVVSTQEENNKRTKRFAHHTSEHTAEQKRDATKLAPGKKVVPKQEENIKRTKRNPHHTPEHTAEQKRDAAKLAPGKKVVPTQEENNKRTKRFAHHTPEHTAEQKRIASKLSPAKKVVSTQEENSKRIKRNPHHTPEHTAEQKRDTAKLAPGKKVVPTQEENNKRTKRFAHHTPEHTAEQKKIASKLSPAKKVVSTQEENIKRIKRNPHHTPEHTAEQKRDAAKLAPGKKVVSTQEENNKRTKRFAHHTPEHTAEQKRIASKLSPAKKVVSTQEENSKRIKRNPHHTPEHTAEQKRIASKLAPAKKVVSTQEENSKRIKRNPHHTPEHTAEQKRDAAKLAPGKKVVATQEENNKRTKRNPHHTPEHTAEQKRDAAKLAPGKKVVATQEESNKRTKRNPHHTPEHTAEQKRDAAKLAPGKKVVATQEESNKRTKRNPHHTPEHTAEQKRDAAKLAPGKKVVATQKESNKRTKRNPHHTPEHTAEQKRDAAKLAPGKKVVATQEESNKRTKRNPHHTPEHTAEQKRDAAKLAPGKKVVATQEESNKRTKRNPHHTPEHTAEQKRDATKLAPGKKVVATQEESNKRTKRNPHHTPEHTAEQKRDATKLAPGKKVIPTQEEKNKRIKRNPHHTPEHTAEQKRDAAKLAPGKKVIPTQEESNKRTKRNPHHTLEHTAEQKRNAAKLAPGKKFSEQAEEDKKGDRIKRSPHHTPEHTAEQMRENEDDEEDHDHSSHNHTHVEVNSAASIFKPLSFTLICVILINLL